jgi:hypothetical protein
MAELKQLVRLLIVAGAFLVQVPSGPVAVATIAVGSGIGVSACGGSCSHCCECAFRCGGTSGTGTVNSPNGCLDCDDACGSLSSQAGCSSSSVTSAGECK